MLPISFSRFLGQEPDVAKLRNRLAGGVSRSVIFQRNPAGATTCFHSPTQIALIQLIRAFLAIQRASQIRIAILNIAIQENLPNALALVTRRMKTLFLGELDQWVRCSDAEDPGMVHRSPAHSCEVSVLPS
jgi:hypothetical protein